MRSTWLIVIGVAAATPATARDIPVPAGGAYDAPAFGERQQITAVYQAPDGHPVFEIFFRDHGVGRTDFYDTKTGRLLFPDQEVAMAYSPGGALENRLRPANLTHIDMSAIVLKGPDPQQTVSNSYGGGSVCHEPYSSYTTITGFDTTVDIAFFTKSASPKLWSGPCDGGSATLHFTGLTMDVMAPDASGFFGLFADKSRLVRFDWSGHSDFFRGQSDIIAIPYDRLGDIAGESEDAGRFAKTDTLIARQAARQMKEKSHE